MHTCVWVGRIRRAFVCFPWLFVLVASVSRSTQEGVLRFPVASTEGVINVKKLRFIVLCRLTDIHLEEFFSPMCHFNGFKSKRL